MAKVIIPSQVEVDIEVQGVGALHPVDQQMIGEILERMEPSLRQQPAITSLQDVAVRFFGDEQLHSDATMLLRLAKEAGEPTLPATIEAQRLTLH